MEDPIAHCARDIGLELEWFGRLLSARLELYFDAGSEPDEPVIPAPPDLGESDSMYARCLRENELEFGERVALALSLVPHVRPQLLDVLFTKNATFDRIFTEFGGLRPASEGAFHPTGETLAFVLGGNDLWTRFEVQRMLAPDGRLARRDLLRLARTTSDAPFLAAPLRISDDLLAAVTTGAPRRPEFGADFPAQHIETLLDWDDLVLHPRTLRQVEEIGTWIEHGRTLMEDWGMARKLRPGFRSLFYGPPGTGKTMTACLLAKSTNRDVYKVDLSLVVSKYIGETEKNLARVFDQAQNKSWILFFDEADALFGKRSETKDAHDRYANQEISFLLQRIETFDGIAILASNLRENLDDAFTRRFESIIYFPMPRPEERHSLWRRGFSPAARLAKSLDLDQVARDHELSGGSIMNVVRYVSLQAVKDGGRIIELDDVVEGIQREYAKEGRSG